jgi:RNA polymerase sigma-70 factor (ECF subfamily)
MTEIKGPDEEKAFRDAYRGLYDKLLRFVAGYIPDKGEAESIVQNCFTKLWENRGTVLNEKNMTGWLFTVARHECLTYISHSRVAGKYEASVYQRELNANHRALSRLDFDQFNRFDIEDIIRKTLDALPKRCRQVFELSRDHNMKNQDIAREFNISVKAVEAQITRALLALRTALREYL